MLPRAVFALVDLANTRNAVLTPGALTVGVTAPGIIIAADAIDAVLTNPALPIHRALSSVA